MHQKGYGVFSFYKLQHFDRIYAENYTFCKRPVNEPVRSAISQIWQANDKIDNRYFAACFNLSSLKPDKVIVV